MPDWFKWKKKVKVIKDEPPWYETEAQKQILIDMGYLPEVKETILQVVTREAWRARPPVEEVFLKRRAMHVFYTLSYTPICKKLRYCCNDMRRMQNKALDEDKDIDIAPNFLIGYDGRVYEGRGWGRVPKLPKPHTRMARTSFNLCFIANADCECDLQMYDAKFDLIEYGEAMGYINPDYEILEPRRDPINEGNEFFQSSVFEYDD